MIGRLLLKKISLAGIARVCDVFETWLQDYVNRKYEAVPRQVKISAKKRKTDERCSVMRCGHLLAISATNCGFGLLLMSKLVKLLGFILVIAPNKEPKNFGILCQASTVSVRSLTQIFGGLTLLYSLHSYKAVGKESGKTNYIERFNYRYLFRNTKKLTERLSVRVKDLSLKL